MRDSNHDSKHCPLSAVDRRLSDLHRQWHQAEEAYFNPEEFRISIQTAIQTARTVTFILQSNKSIIPDFENWYSKWQERLKALPLMRWMVDARNKIEKQGDLEQHSVVHAEIISSYYDDGMQEEIPAELFEGLQNLIERIPTNDEGAHIRKDGVLRVERRWVENTLPDYELLDAVAVAYGHLALLVSDAHKQMGLPEPIVVTDEGEIPYDRAMAGGRLPCMIGHSERRSLNIWIATGERFDFERKSETVSRENLEEAAERYGFDTSKMFSASGDLYEIAREYFEVARRLFLQDGHHVFAVFIFKDKKMINMRELRVDEHGQKYILMRQLANDVLRLGGDAVLIINEVWRAKFKPQYRYRRVAEIPGREEGLAATLIAKDGEPLELYAPINRSGENVDLGETIEMKSVSVSACAPIYNAWGREMPSQLNSDTLYFSRPSSLMRKRMKLLSTTAISSTYSHWFDH
ncbi:hypothetical protein PsAD46_05419 [Pseudovibrio sp. Ad46]|uniref:hypothetical protein n=1 Tax=Pseudovibrio sp. Ad46 TaxID=989432 RepID=UPI0007AE4BEB|nr:hypothetical protein [Pseudovibrio sp. Ad46]KZK76161.1 hypothetical protein PsAD46_05419 [Pseudovibrio sp. Ad46]